MSDDAAKLKGEILRDPALILDDPDLMAALLAKQAETQGRNVVDLRSIAMSRMEERLDKLEQNYQTVVAAAYENVTGTNQVHRAILCLLGVDDFSGFLQALEHDIPNILGVDAIRLCLEDDSAKGGEEIGPDGPLKHLVMALPRYGVAAYVNGGVNKHPAQVTTRATNEAKESVYGEAAVDIHSEALLRLDLGEGKLPGMVAFGAQDPNQFSPDQGTDLLSFFGYALERIMRHWVT